METADTTARCPRRSLSTPLLEVKGGKDCPEQTVTESGVALLMPGNCSLDKEFMEEKHEEPVHPDARIMNTHEPNKSSETHKEHPHTCRENQSGPVGLNLDAPL